MGGAVAWVQITTEARIVRSPWSWSFYGYKLPGGGQEMNLDCVEDHTYF